jgi:hypothetical protein
MSDFDKVMAHVRLVPTDEYDQGEISDACARVIASWFVAGSNTEAMSFVSTGAIVGDTSALWRQLGGDIYNAQTPDDRLFLDFLGTYILNRADKGPVEGWSNLWL